MSASLLVDIEKLEAYSKVLLDGKTTLEGYLEDSKTQMTVLTNSWKDDSGALLKSKFEEFLTASVVLCDEMEALGSYAQSLCNDYNTNITSYLSEMI